MFFCQFNVFSFKFMAWIWLTCTRSFWSSSNCANRKLIRSLWLVYLFLTCVLDAPYIASLFCEKKRNNYSFLGPYKSLCCVEVVWLRFVEVNSKTAYFSKNCSTETWQIGLYFLLWATCCKCINRLTSCMCILLSGF